MDDVAAAFRKLGTKSSVMQINTGRSFPQGYNKGYMPYSEHFQGIQRQQDSPYLFISGSGETESKGHLLVAELASKGEDIAGPLGSNSKTTWGRKVVPSQDVVKKVVAVDSGDLWHAGGLTSYGKYLVVGAEAGCSSTSRALGMCSDKSAIHFYDMTSPLAPKKLPYVVDRPTATAGAAAIMQQKDGKYLLVVGRVDSAILDFYLSKGTSLDKDPGFKLVKTWYKSALQASAGQMASFGEYQNLNFVRQKDGTLFMVGTYRTMMGLGTDTADLFQVSDKWGFRAVSIKKVESVQLTCESGTCNFQAGAGAYVDSPTSLIVYSTNWEPSSGKIYVNEFVGTS